MSLAFVLVLVAALLTLVCTFVPAIPATLILLLGVVVAALLDGYQGSDLPILLSFAVLTVLVMLVDNLASAWGTRRYGGSRQATWGALIGGVVGLFVPFGIVLGPLLGAFLAELLLVGKPLREALLSAWGTLVGLLSGVAAKLALHLLMAAYALWHFWVA